MRIKQQIEWARENPDQFRDRVQTLCRSRRRGAVRVLQAAYDAGWRPEPAEVSGVLRRRVRRDVAEWFVDRFDVRSGRFDVGMLQMERRGTSLPEHLLTGRPAFRNLDLLFRYFDGDHEMWHSHAKYATRCGFPRKLEKILCHARTHLYWFRWVRVSYECVALLGFLGFEYCYFRRWFPHETLERMRKARCELMNQWLLPPLSEIVDEYVVIKKFIA